MRKNGSRFISFKQYKLTDLFLFAVILIAFDLVAHFAPRAFASGANFTFILTVPIVLLIMVRWGWPCVFFAIGDGLFLSLLNNTAVWQSYLCYAAGNCFILLLMLATKFFGKQKIAGKWYFSVLFVIFGWVLQNLGLTLAMTAIYRGNFLSYLFANLGFGGSGLMSLAAGIVIILILRRLDGMFEDQKSYLKRLDAEAQEMRRIDEFGETPIEIDEESLSILNKRDDELGK